MLGKIRDRLDGAMNPIMLKEMWQSVHSKVSMAVFWLLLAAAVFIYCICATQKGGPSGGDMFAAFSVMMGVTAMLVIPALTYASLYREISSNTMELLQITAMSAGQLVRGRLLAAAVRILLLFSLVAPFAVASYLFGGVELVGVLATVYILLLVSVAASATAVLFASLAAYRRIRALARLGFGALVVVPLLLLLSSCPALVRFGPLGAHFGSGSVTLRSGIVSLAFLGWPAVLAALFVMLVSAAAANALTFPHGRSSSRTKFFLLLLGLGLFGVFVTVRLMGAGPGAGVAFEVQACLFIGFCSLVWITADPHLPYRQRVKLAEWGPLRRALFYPFTDGAASTAVYTFLMLGGVVIGMIVLDSGSGAPWTGSEFNVHPAVLTLTYVLYLSAGAGAGTYLLAPRTRTAFARRIVLLGIVLVNVAALIAALAFDWGVDAKPELPVAFLPLLYVVSDFSSLSDMTFLAHMAGPLALGAVYHLAIRGPERRRLEAEAPAPLPERE